MSYGNACVASLGAVAAVLADAKGFGAELELLQLQHRELSAWKLGQCVKKVVTS